MKRFNQATSMIVALSMILAQVPATVFAGDFNQKYPPSDDVAIVKMIKLDDGSVVEATVWEHEEIFVLNGKEFRKRNGFARYDKFINQGDKYPHVIQRHTVWKVEKNSQGIDVLKVHRDAPLDLGEDKSKSAADLPKQTANSPIQTVNTNTLPPDTKKETHYLAYTAAAVAVGAATYFGVKAFRNRSVSVIDEAVEGGSGGKRMSAAERAAARSASSQPKVEKVVGSVGKGYVPPAGTVTRVVNHETYYVQRDPSGLETWILYDMMLNHSQPVMYPQPQQIVINNNYGSEPMGHMSGSNRAPAPAEEPVATNRNWGAGSNAPAPRSEPVADNNYRTARNDAANNNYRSSSSSSSSAANNNYSSGGSSGGSNNNYSSGGNNGSSGGSNNAIIGAIGGGATLLSVLTGKRAEAQSSPRASKEIGASTSAELAAKKKSSGFTLE